jgi:hypothetical protein
VQTRWLWHVMVQELACIQACVHINNLTRFCLQRRMQLTSLFLEMTRTAGGPDARKGAERGHQPLVYRYCLSQHRCTSGQIDDNRVWQFLRVRGCQLSAYSDVSAARRHRQNNQAGPTLWLWCSPSTQTRFRLVVGHLCCLCRLFDICCRRRRCHRGGNHFCHRRRLK